MVLGTPWIRWRSEDAKSDKVFVGGLQKACTEEEMCKWFSKLGTILKSEVKIDRVTDFQCSTEPSHVTTSMSEKLMIEEVDEIAQ